MTERLKLRAEDAEDLGVISAHLQDGLVTFGDMDYLGSEKQFVLVVNRFCWSDCPQNPKSGKPFERVLCGLRFDGVKNVRLRNLDRKNGALVLELLAIKPENGFIDLLFAGRGRVRLEVDAIRCHLQDLDSPWPTQWRPQHPIADAE